MSDPLLRLSAPHPVSRRDCPALPVGRQLVNDGLISQTTLLEALSTQRRIDAPLGEILVAEGHVARENVLAALAVQYNADRVDLCVDPPAPAMAKALPARLCQRFGVVPWRWIGATLLVATSRPDRLVDLAAALPRGAPDLLPVIADQDQVIQQTGILYGVELARHAVTRVPEEHSCRTWSLGAASGRVQVAGVGVLVLGLAVAFPVWTLTLLIGIAVVTLAMTTTLKAFALAARITHGVAARVEPLARPPGARSWNKRAKRLQQSLIERWASLYAG